MTNSEKVLVDFAYRSLNKYSEELCGDRVQMRMDDDSTIMVLADGLGSGVKANILSTLTSTIISDMLRYGADIEDVVSTIASTLPVCSERKVAYSTFTILKVFDDGNAQMAEYDNPAAIFMRKGKVIDLERIPHTICGKEIRISGFHVEPDDHIFMFSDGVLNASEGEILNLDWGHKEIREYILQYVRDTDRAEEASRILLACVNDLYGGKCLDDTTVACAHILPAKESVVLFGPPADKAKDKEVTEILLSAPGKKIVCGGTTGQLVAREMKQEAVILETGDTTTGIPPMGFIQGIDLVTEGVLTVQRCDRILDACASDEEFRKEFIGKPGKDGASLLAYTLMEECTSLRILVGCAENKGYTDMMNPLFSVDGKKKLIERIAENLRKFGKRVSVEYT